MVSLVVALASVSFLHSRVAYRRGVVLALDSDLNAALAGQQINALVSRLAMHNHSPAGGLKPLRAPHLEQFPSRGLH